MTKIEKMKQNKLPTDIQL